MIKIIKFSDQKLYVSFLSYGEFICHWNKLENILRGNNLNDITVIVDYVIQNGLHNRFFTTLFLNGNLSEDIRFIDLDRSQERIFNQFLRSHPSIIRKSIVSNIEKKRIFKYISES